MGDHCPQGAGLAVGERDRLGRRAGRSEIDRRRWLYTAITRAERGLVLLA
ncbi:MAG: ATP-binding domain-containing protein [Rhodobacteraceae bacterium]|nr:ATP-binding domain-containing protein [Paracoccaceae bacterium]